MKTDFDQASPEMLKLHQTWFASIITQPIDEASRLPLKAPSGADLQEEAWNYIKPGPVLQPAQRIELYAQQYWWRLLNTLQDTYPLVTRLFGYRDFNLVIGMPYLIKYPPTHWSLNLLGASLPQWIEESYHASDKSLVLDASKLDYAYLSSFLAPEKKPLDVKDLPDSDDFSYLLTARLYLQPFLYFFDFSYDLFTFRQQFLQESADYWVDHDFPPLTPTDKPFVLFRNVHGQTVWDPISPAELKLLSYFKAGATIESACDRLEVECPEAFAEAERHLHHWIQAWIIKKWLSLEA